MKLWIKRFAALLIDFFIITLITWITGALIYPLIAIMDAFYILNYWLVLVVFIIIGYFTYFEGKNGATAGKNILKIKVIADEGQMNYKKALIRNLSKILWVPLILDVLIGWVAGNSKLRYLDKLAGTDVVRGSDKVSEN
ncbi:MAG: RDD family protein [Methanobacteriaceae archaeon]|jgi:uncharacterized RDD family membrane protein YckC